MVTETVTETAAFLAPRSIRLLGRPDLVDVCIRLGIHTLGAYAALDPVAAHQPVGHAGGLRQVDLHQPGVAGAVLDQQDGGLLVDHRLRRCLVHHSRRL